MRISGHGISGANVRKGDAVLAIEAGVIGMLTAKTAEGDGCAGTRNALTGDSETLFQQIQEKGFGRNGIITDSYPFDDAVRVFADFDKTLQICSKPCLRSGLKEWFSFGDKPDFPRVLEKRDLSVSGKAGIAVPYGFSTM